MDHTLIDSRHLMPPQATFYYPTHRVPYARLDIPPLAKKKLETLLAPH